MPYVEGCIAVPDAPGLGIELDRDKVLRYAELFKKLGPYPFDRDPRRPDWYSIWPETRWAKPGV